MRPSFKFLLILSILPFSFSLYGQDHYVDPAGSCGGNSPCYTTIGAAITAASPGDIIQVGDGVYNENMTIDKDLSLISENGRALTVIQGQSGVGGQGTVLITGTTSSVQLGSSGQGFTIIGFDDGVPAVEDAAVYVEGNHGTITIQDNEIQANGEAGLLGESGLTMTGVFIVDNNAFTGQTFQGAQPGDCGFGNQFSAPNVPRQLVAINPGTFSAGMEFTNNAVVGTAGGTSSTPPCDVTGQGNSLVTLDVPNALIDGNYFNGTTARFGSSLRIRRGGATITNNCFFNDGLATNNLHLFADASDIGDAIATTGGSGQGIADVADDNVFQGEGWYFASAGPGQNSFRQADFMSALTQANADCALLMAPCGGTGANPTGCGPDVVPTMGQWALFLFGLSVFTLGLVVVYNVKQLETKEAR